MLKVSKVLGFLTMVLLLVACSPATDTANDAAFVEATQAGDNDAWEYLRIRNEGATFSEEIDKAGADGWELVAIVTGMGQEWVFKRKIS